MAEQNQEKTEEKTEQKAEKAQEIKVLDTGKRIIVRGADLPISTKHSIAICKMIKNKTLNQAIPMLQQVIEYKRAVPMEGDEIPHRKGMGSGRYPQNATAQFIRLLKNLRANASNAGVDPSQMKINAKSDVAARRRYSRKAKHFKRTHVLIELKK